MNENRRLFGEDNEPLYSIGAVSRTTGIPETTLRVWERRYDFPESSRTDGGHRLYSQYEITRIQWVKEQIDNGMQVSNAIKALYHAEKNGLASAAYAVSAGNGDAFSAVYDRLLTALLEHDPDESERVIAEALTVYSIEHLIFHVISPILNEIGNRWESGTLNVATEHFSTNFLRQHLLYWMRVGPPIYHVPPVVLTCAPGEFHEGSLLMLGVLLRRLRWPVSYLGQSIVLQDFAIFADEMKPSVIVFVAMTKESAEALTDWPQWLPEVHQSGVPPVCYGGRIFSIEPGYVDRVPGIFLGQTIEEGITTVNRILREIHPFVR